MLYDIAVFTVHTTQHRRAFTARVAVCVDWSHFRGVVIPLVSGNSLIIHELLPERMKFVCVYLDTILAVNVNRWRLNHCLDSGEGEYMVREIVVHCISAKIVQHNNASVCH